MTGSVPWSVNAVDPEAWANARDAARREGLSVGEWLEATIRDAASQQERGGRHVSRGPSADVIERRLDDIADRLDLVARRAHEPAPAPRSTRSDAALHHSIESLTNRIETLAREMRAGDRNGPSEIRTAIQRLEDRIDDLATRGRLASANIPAELEQKLETISRTIETMSRRLELENDRYAMSSVPASVDELDYAVAEIMMRQSALDGVPPPPREPRRPLPERHGPDLSGLESQLRLITEEMQAMRRANAQTESIDALRREFRELADKLGELAPRHSLESLKAAIDSVALRVDRASIARSDETLTEVVDALHDIRSALAEVRPAESFKSVERDLHELSNKLDNLNLKGVDERTVVRLQQQTSEIRDLLSGALPSDVLKALVDQIELLVHKFEDPGTRPNNAIVDVLEGLDRRIDALSERIDTASRQGPAPAALEEIRARLDDLQKVVAATERRDESNFESALQALAQKIDATDARLGNLGSIERGLKDLAAQLQEVRASTIEAFVKSAGLPPREATVRPEPAKPHWAEPLAGEPEIPAEPRIVSVRSETRAPSVPSRSTPENETPDNIPADYPLEPGSGAPHLAMQSAALRVAQSEAALGETAQQPAKEASMRTSDFIAAARRAAQAAAAEPTREPAARIKSLERKGGGFLFGNTRRSLLIALTAFLIIFVALRFFDARSLIPFGSLSIPATNAPAAPIPAPVTPEPTTPPAQDFSDLPTPADALAAMPPAGVIGHGQDLPFLAEGVDPSTTGSTGTVKAEETMETAVAPAGTEAAPETADALPGALGTPALRAAAIAGDPAAAYEIGVRYLEGRGVKASAAEATEWLGRAAAKGSIPAAYRLGSIHEKGTGAAKNSAEAMRYYTIAAEGGNIKAMHNLAVMIAEGANGKPDYRAASRWFRMAAERGVRDSQYNLGVLYARGLGVEQNFAESYRWFALAANQGDSDAGAKRDDVAKRLDVQTLVAAKLAVQTWQPAATKADANEVRLKPEWDKAEAAPRKRTVKK